MQSLKLNITGQQIEAQLRSFKMRNTRGRGGMEVRLSNPNLARLGPRPAEVRLAPETSPNISELHSQRSLKTYAFNSAKAVSIRGIAILTPPAFAMSFRRLSSSANCRSRRP